MMKLYRIALKSDRIFDKKIRNLYVIAKDKQSAIDYVNIYKRDYFIIYKVYYLGYELSSTMFAGGKNENF